MSSLPYLRSVHQYNKTFENFFQFDTIVKKWTLSQT